MKIFSFFLLIISSISILFLFLFKYNKSTNPSHLYFEPSSGNHTHTIIFMPGLTNTPEDFQKVLTQRIPMKKRNTTKVILLRSPQQKVTVLNYTKNHSWFDIYYFPLNSSDSYNFEELKKSSIVLQQIIKEEANILGGKYDKIIIGGHSQGAMISLYTGYIIKYLLGGIISFSGVLPPIKKENILADKKNLNVFYAYGDSDNLIVPKYFNDTIEDIKDFDGLYIRIYKDHKHNVIQEEMNDAGEFLDKIM